MGTRPGDLDPGLVFYLMRLQGGSAADATHDVEQMLNKRSGMLALSGLSNDMRLLRDAEKNGNAQAALAIEVFALSVKKMIGGYVTLMGGLDALVFSGGIGERDPMTRTQVCAGMDVFGLTLDPEANNLPMLGRRPSASRIRRLPSMFCRQTRIALSPNTWRAWLQRINRPRAYPMPSTSWDRREETRCPALQSCATQLPLPR